MDNPQYDLAIYLVVRKDLKMGTGKIVAQCGHAVAELIWGCSEREWREYSKSGCAKICLKIDTYEDFKVLEQSLINDKIQHYVVVDAGRTQVEPDTETCLGIGPISKELAKKYVQNLKLL